jgi:alkylation response protein AidB-like acyl-CoA dehydrogenase
VWASAGLFSVGFPADGGFQMPATLSLFASGMLSCANLGIANYLLLTIANANMLNAFGTPEQKAMFLASIGVGMNSTMSALAGYLFSLEYARTRLQGRPPHNQDPRSRHIPIIEHTHFKRMPGGMRGCRSLLGQRDSLPRCVWLHSRRLAVVAAGYTCLSGACGNPCGE